MINRGHHQAHSRLKRRLIRRTGMTARRDKHLRLPKRLGQPLALLGRDRVLQLDQVDSLLVADMLAEIVH